MSLPGASSLKSKTDLTARGRFLQVKDFKSFQGRELIDSSSELVSGPRYYCLPIPAALQLASLRILWGQRFGFKTKT